MPRKLSHMAPDWWDYTTLDDELINDAAEMAVKFAFDFNGATKRKSVIF